jgi:hypothetical protein
VIRLLISMLCALGLAFSPVAANAAVSQASGMPGCTMDGKMPAKTADHAKMDCCAAACQAPSSAALTPNQNTAHPVAPVRSALLSWAPVKELYGIDNSGLDPPPRA